MVACFVFYGIVFLMFGSCVSCWKHQAQTQSQNGNRLLIACTQRAYRLWDISLLVYRRQDTIRTKFLTKSFIWVRCVFVGPPPSPHITVSNVCNTWRKICAQARHLCYSWTINPGAWEISFAFFIVHRSRKDQKKGSRFRTKKGTETVMTHIGSSHFLAWFLGRIMDAIFPALVPETSFSAGGIGAVFYTHETWTPVHLWDNSKQPQHWLLRRTPHGCLVGLSGRRTPHATRLACEARQVHSHLSLPVRLSACLSVDHCWEPTAPTLVANIGWICTTCTGYVLIMEILEIVSLRFHPQGSTRVIDLTDQIHLVLDTWVYHHL